MSLAMYALSFAQYAVALLPSGGSEKIIALSVGTIFFILNFFGVDLMAKIQNLLVIVLLISLTMFAVFGLPSVDFGTYFSNADGLFLSDGVTGFLTATAYLGFATGGATVILGVSSECKNPTKDTPFVIVTSTVGVALLYGLVATTASGVLPVAEVANQPLTLVAAEILPKPLYIFFIVGGAMFALATTLNSQIMSATKPIMQACEAGSPRAWQNAPDTRPPGRSCSSSISFWWFRFCWIWRLRRSRRWYRFWATSITWF